MSMLADFFDVRKDSSKHFAGLAIAKHTQICNQWMNQYPTIFVSLKDVYGYHFDAADVYCPWNVISFFNGKILRIACTSFFMVVD